MAPDWWKTRSHSLDFLFTRSKLFWSENHFNNSEPATLGSDVKGKAIDFLWENLSNQHSCDEASWEADDCDYALMSENASEVLTIERGKYAKEIFGIFNFVLSLEMTRSRSRNCCEVSSWKTQAKIAFYQVAFRDSYSDLVKRPERWKVLKKYFRDSNRF